MTKVYSFNELLIWKNRPECLPPPNFAHLDPETFKIVVRDSDNPLKSARSLLNKLTPENFSMLSADFVEIVGRLDPADVAKIVSLIVTKAMIDVKFSSLYANLCLRIRNEKQSWNISPERKRAVVVDLVSQVRDEFHKYVAKTADPETFSEIDKKDLEGVVRFISQLYQNGIVHSRVAFFCADHLVENWNEETAEQLCRLLLQCGEQMERVNSNAVSTMIQILETRLRDRSCSKRIVFLLEDTIKLRQRGWKQRHEYQKQKVPELRTSTVRATEDRGQQRRRTGKSQQARSSRQPQQQQQQRGTKKPPRRRKPLKLPPPKKPVFDETIAQRRINNLFHEFLSVRIVEEVAQTTSEFKDYANENELLKMFAQIFVSESIWKSEEELIAIAEMLSSICLENDAIRRHIQEEISAVESNIDELKIDIPKIDHLCRIFREKFQR